MYLPPLSEPGYDYSISAPKKTVFDEINKLALYSNNVFNINEVESSDSKRNLIESLVELGTENTGTDLLRVCIY